MKNNYKKKKTQTILATTAKYRGVQINVYIYGMKKMMSILLPLIICGE